MSEHELKNMKLISHNSLQGFGGLGEGMSMQLAKGGRRIMWLAHEGPPKNFTGVDVSDPREPKVIVQTDLPHTNMRSNSLEVCGDIMAVAYQTYGWDIESAGIELFDISNPEAPKSISFFDCSGPRSRGVHCVWYVDGEYIHCASGAADYMPRHPRDDQCYRIIDVRDPSKPEETGRWWLPGTEENDDTPPLPRLYDHAPDDPRGRDNYRVHNSNVYPDQPDRAYIGYLDGGAIILDISDKSKPQFISQWNPHPPYPGFTHTALPLPERDLMIVADESNADDAADWPKLTWVLDIREEKNPVSIATFPMPELDDFRDRGGRFGSHNLHENRPGPSFRSDTIIFATFFNGGVRAFDLSKPYQPKDVASFVPACPEGSRYPASQINDVYVDENGLIYAAERISGGLYILESDF
ncbi:MAG: hypothetical protein OEU46_08505 [Alphaproteobacteria bacterium]|nr:hypothetical protein [Alphaproteobacteria bacterium]